MRKAYAVFLATALAGLTAHSLPPAPQAAARDAESDATWKPYREAVIADLKKASTRIEVVEAKARASGGQALAKADETILDLRLRHAEVADLLDRFDAAPANEKDALRKRLDETLSALRAELSRNAAN